MLKLYIPFFFIQIILYSCQSKKIQINESNLAFRIDFQDGFISDTISVSINKCQVVNKKILTSNKLPGVTDLQLLVYSNGSDNHEIHDKKQIIKCENKDTIRLLILFNSAKLDYVGYLSKGKYFGFNKINSQKLEFEQSVVPFYYD